MDITEELPEEEQSGNGIHEPVKYSERFMERTKRILSNRPDVLEALNSGKTKKLGKLIGICVIEGNDLLGEWLDEMVRFEKDSK